MNSIIVETQEIMSQASNQASSHVINQEDLTITLTNNFKISHIIKHLKKREGDFLKVTLLGKGITQAKIVQIKSSAISLQVKGLAVLNSNSCHLLVAYSRPQAIKKILEYGATLGLRKISFFRSDLSDKSYEQSKIFDPSNYKKLLLKGLSQSSYYSCLPIIEKIERKSSFNLHNESSTFFLSLDSNKNLLNYLSAEEVLNQEFNFIIGPERGWSEKEELFFKSKKYKPLLISHSTLRTEHATLSILAQLEMLKISL